MNTQGKPLMTVYVVEATNQLKSNHYKPQTFHSWNGYLLTARKAAFEYAHRLLIEKGDNESLAITINLVEVDRSQIPNSTQVIATVLQQKPMLISSAINWPELELTEPERAYYQANGHLLKFGVGW